MNRKIVSFLLAVLMVLSLPFTVLAETQKEVLSFSSSYAQNVEGLSELLDVFTIESIHDDNALELTFALNGNGIVSLQLSADAKGLYCTSELLDNKTYYAGWDYLLSLLGADMGSADTEIVTSFSGITTEMSNLFAQIDPSLYRTMNTDLLYAYYDQLDLILPGVGTWAKNIYANAETENGTYEVAGMDTAGRKVTITVTADDLLEMMNIESVRSLLDELLEAMLKSYNPDATEEEMQSNIAAVYEAINRTYASSGLGETLVLYCKENEWVGFEFSTDMLNALTGNEDQEIIIEGSLYCTVNGETVDYTLSGALNYGESAIEVAGAFRMNGMVPEDVYCALLIGGNEISYLLTIDQQSDAKVLDYSVYLRTNAVKIIKPSASSSAIFAMHAEITKPENDFVSALDIENAIDLSTYSEEDYTDLLQSLSTKAYGLLGALLMNLPAESYALIGM